MNQQILKSLLVAAGVSIVGVAHAAEIALFETRDMSDASTALRGDVGDLAAFGAPTTIRAINVAGGHWELCSEREFRGRCRIFAPGQTYRDLQERVMSARELRYRVTENVDPRAQPRVEIYPDVDFRGAGQNQFRSFDSQRFGVRSMIVHAGTWELCSDIGSRGRCQTYQPGEYRQVDGQIMGARSLRLVAGYGVQPQAVAPPVGTRVDPVGAIAGAIIGGLVGASGVNPNQAPPPVGQVGQSGQYNGRVHFFPGGGLTGQPLSLVGDVPNFQNFGFNDRTQSIRVESGVWEVCTESNFAGVCRTLTPGDYPALYNSMLDRSISSARMVQQPASNLPAPTQDGTFPAGAPETPHAIFLFSENDFRGETFRSNSDMENLRNTSMNDRTVSIFVRYGRWEFCTDGRFRGTCITLSAGSYGRMQYPMEGSISSFRRVQ